MLSFARDVRKDGLWAAISHTRFSSLAVSLYFHLPKRFRTSQFSLDDQEVSVRLDTSPEGGTPALSFEREEDEIELFVESIREDDVVFDIGANVGVYTMFAAAKARSGQVYAFEPNPNTIRTIERNVELNGFENVDVCEYALTDVNGCVEFSMPTASPGYKEGVVQKPVYDEQRKLIRYEVDGWMGDTLVSDQGFPQPNVVKIDVEGAEPAVCRGMREVLAHEDCRTLFIEVHRDNMYSEGATIGDFGMEYPEIVQFIEDLGFEQVRQDYGSGGDQIHLKFDKSI